MFTAFHGTTFKSFKEEDIAYFGLKEVAGSNVWVDNGSHSFSVFVLKAELKRMLDEDPTGLIQRMVQGERYLIRRLCEEEADRESEAFMKWCSPKLKLGEFEAELQKVLETPE